MDKTRLFNVLTSEGKCHPYGMVSSLEAEGRFPGAECVKITDSLFLAKTQGRTEIYDADKDRCLSRDELPVSDILDGVVTEISMAPDVILPAVFSEGKAVFGEEEFCISVREITEKMLLITFEEGDLILADISRFLLYGMAGGQFICGYIEV